MKFGIKSIGFISTTILGAALLLVGCGTTGNQRSANTRMTMKDVEQDYIQAIAQVDATNGSMEALVSTSQPDEKKALEVYSNNVNKMDDLGKRLFEHADNMRTQQKDYFEEWRMQGNTYTDPQIQALSEQRRADLSVIFANIAQASVGVKGSFKDYMSHIGQIRTFLSTDLTPKGLDSINPNVQQAVLDGANLKEGVKPVLAAIASARAELAQDGSK
jgi:hypothetical protein